MNNQGLSNSQDPDIEGNAEAEQDDLESLFNDISGAMNDRGKLNKLLNAPDDPNKSGQKRSNTGVITEVSDEDEGLVGPDGRVKADTDTDISEEPDEDDSEPEADTGEAKPAEAKEASPVPPADPAADVLRRAVHLLAESKGEPWVNKASVWPMPAMQAPPA